ncbi:MAG: hypothetical protein JSR98_00865 [Proteobacteria bacterium]|nr:hypothetical protein [Pseudomonadota bacterium]
MRRAAILLAGVAAALVAGLAVAGQPPQGQPPQPPPDPAAVLQGVCSMCHGVDFIAEHHKDRDGWDFTVHRMMDKGADLDPDTAALLIDYLAKTYPADPKPAAPPPGNAKGSR